MNETIRLDFRDILRFEQTCSRLGEQTALKAARKAAHIWNIGKIVRANPNE